MTRRSVKSNNLSSRLPHSTNQNNAMPMTIGPKPIDRTRLTLAVCAALIFAVVAFLLTGPMWPVFVWGMFNEGLVAAAWLCAAAGIGAWAIAALRVPRCRSRTLSFVTSAGTGLGIFSLLILLLGLTGWLNRSSSIAILAVGMVAGIVRMLAIVRAKKASNVERAAASASEYLWLLAIPFLATAMVCAFVLPGLLWGDEPHGYDVLEYHLQVPREWFELGRIAPLQHNVFSYFPFNVEMHYLLAMHLSGGPWQGMYLAKMMHMAFIALSVLAVFAFLRERGRLRTAVASAVLVGVAPYMTMLAGVAYDEGGLLLFGTLAIGWAMIALEVEDSRQCNRMMILAGAMAGFACGVKLTAVPMVLMAVAVAFVLIKRRLRPAIIFVFAALLTFSPWVIRNIAWTGNPVFPEATGIFGQAHFTDAQIERFRVAHSPTPDERSIAGRFKAAWNQILADGRYGFIIIPLALIAIALERRRAASIYLSILLLICAIVWLGFTHLQGRFFILALPIAGLLIGSVDRRGWTLTLNLCAAAGCVCGFVYLFGRLDTKQHPTQLIGIRDLRPLLSQQVADAIARGRPIALVGDAEAFIYQMPMSRLYYRTVFDVDVRPGESIIDAWKRGAPADALVVVNRNELERFAKTYASIPQPPAQPPDESKPPAQPPATAAD